MNFIRIIMCTIPIIFLLGCDTWVDGVVVLKGQTDSGKTNSYIVDRPEINKVIKITDKISRANNFIKLDKFPENFPEINLIAGYYVKEGVSNGHIAFVVYLKDKESLIVDIRGVGNIKNRDLGLKLQKQIFDSMVSEFGQERVLTLSYKNIANWRNPDLAGGPGIFLKLKK